MDTLHRDTQPALSSRELAALKAIGKHHFGTDYWEDGTIRLYRRFGLVAQEGERIILTAAGWQATQPRSPAPDGGVDLSVPPQKGPVLL